MMVLIIAPICYNVQYTMKRSTQFFMNLDALIDMSNRYGENEEFVVCGGGNTSYKEDGIMYVKGSGSQLATIDVRGFVAMDLQALRDTLKIEYPEDLSPHEIEAKSFSAIMAAKKQGQDEKRPSVESILHALFPYKYVLHLHPPIVNGLTCSVEYEAACERLFGGGATPLAAWVGIVPPGPGLARLCDNAFSHNTCCVHPQIAFLRNHGVFAAADTVGEVDDIMTYIIDKLTGEIKEFPDITDASFVTESIKRFKIKENPLTPEQVLYPDDEALLKNAAKIAVYAQSFGGISPLPKAIVDSMIEFNPYK